MRLLTKKKEKQQEVNGWLLFLSGLSLGAIAALLLAPQKGSESVRQIGDSVSKLATSLSKKAKESFAGAEEEVTEENKNDYTV